jgi:hypothetical protein
VTANDVKALQQALSRLPPDTAWPEYLRVAQEFHTEPTAAPPPPRASRHGFEALARLLCWLGGLCLLVQFLKRVW